MREDLERAYKEAPDKTKKNFPEPKLPQPSDIESHLNPDEKVQSVLKCWHSEIDPRTGKGKRLYIASVAVVTDRAIYLFGTLGLGSKARIETEVIPAHTITGLSSSKVMLSGWGIEITRAGNVDKLLQCEQGQMDKWLASARQLMANNSGGGSNNTTIVQEVDPLDQLKKLKELLDAGILSQEEFDAKKTDILGKI